MCTVALLLKVKYFNVYINVAICFEQGGTDLQMHVHEWLQQWSQL